MLKNLVLSFLDKHGHCEQIYWATCDQLGVMLGRDAEALFRRTITAQDGRFYLKGTYQEAINIWSNMCDLAKTA